MASTVIAFEPMPPTYRAKLEEVLRGFVTNGRGDDARGRHLAALLALETVMQHHLFSYRPSRDAAAWLMLLVDVVGERLALPPAERLDLSVREFLDALDGLELHVTARVTEEALVGALAQRTRLEPTLASGLLESVRVAAMLWALGYRAHGSGGERHPQARHVRKLIRARVDAAWEQQVHAIEKQRRVDSLDLVAALPLSFRHAAKAVQAALLRVDEDLAHVPFAVFYALATDARRGGRVWRPPERYVEGGCYSRAAFDATVGHVLEGTRSRRRRYRRSVALSDLGLSAMYPATVARMDAWLERFDLPELAIGSTGDPTGNTWFDVVTARHAIVALRHRRLVDGLRGDASRAERAWNRVPPIGSAIGSDG